MMDLFARQPDLGPKTVDKDFKASKLAFSDVPSTEMTLSYYDEDSETSIDNDIKNVEKRSVEENQFDETLDSGTNAETLSVVDNNLDAPATAFNSQLGTTSSRKDLADGDFYNKIQPTKSDYLVHQQDSLSTTQENKNDYQNAGEAKRASARGRALPLPEPSSASDLSAQPMNTTGLNSSHRSDNPSPDIQDIINGFVKLLNGNVQVQVNPNSHALGGRPLYPMRTRINNRGPPRITDVPPLEFDPPVPLKPQVNSRPTHPANNLKDPPPYPFDIPPPISSLPPQPNTVLRPFLSGIPIPEQIVPEDPNKVSFTTESDIPMENFNKSFIAPSKTKYNPFGNDYHKTKLGNPAYNDTEPVKDPIKKPGPYKPVNSFIQPSEITPLTKPTFTVVQKEPTLNSSASIQPSTSSAVISHHSETAYPVTTAPVDVNVLNEGEIDVNTNTSVLSLNNSTAGEGLSTSENSKNNRTVPETFSTTTTTTTTTEVPRNSSVGSITSTPLIESSMSEVSILDPQKPVQWSESSSSISTTPLQTGNNQNSLSTPSRAVIVIN